MKVSQLIKYLQKLDQKSTVLISRDEEGNGFGTIVPQSFDTQYADNVVIIFPWKTSDDIEYLVKQK